MKCYKIEKDGNILKIGFGEPAQNDAIVRDAVNRLQEMTESGELGEGKLVKLNGPASLPVAVAIAHAVAHRFETVGVFDPKLGKYVVAVSHSADHKPGDMID